MSTKTRGAERLIVGGSPRADLLPPEFAAEAKLRAQRRGLVGLAVLTVVVVALAYGFLTVQSGYIGQSVVAANETTASLLEQQKEYSEVGVINGQIATIEVAKVVGTSTRIDWTAYLALVQASLPAGTVIDAVDASTAYPGNGVTVSDLPLSFPSVATLAFTASTNVLPNVSSWIENLALLPGFSGATAGSITLCDCGSYTVTMVLYIDDEALANRYPDGEMNPTPAPTETPTPTPTPEATTTRAVVTR